MSATRHLRVTGATGLLLTALLAGSGCTPRSSDMRPAPVPSPAHTDATPTPASGTAQAAAAPLADPVGNSCVSDPGRRTTKLEIAMEQKPTSPVRFTRVDLVDAQSVTLLGAWARTSSAKSGITVVGRWTAATTPARSTKVSGSGVTLPAGKRISVLLHLAPVSGPRAQFEDVKVTYVADGHTFTTTTGNRFRWGGPCGH